MAHTQIVARLIKRLAHWRHHEVEYGDICSRFTLGNGTVAFIWNDFIEDEGIRLERIETDPEYRKTGLAKAGLNSFLAAIDAEQLRVWAEICPDYEDEPTEQQNREQMEKWFEGAGFIRDRRVDQHWLCFREFRYDLPIQPATTITSADE